MPKIIVRDDDTSYFTAPGRLEAIYGRMWAAGLPVCLAVIPKIYGDIRVYWSDGNPHDPALHPSFRGRDECFSILGNPELCAFLDEKAAAGLAEICLHGCTHEFYEFISHDRELIRRKLDEGMSILQRAFPSASIGTFIAPYDRMSPIALEELIARGFHICTMSLNLAPAPALPQISGHAAAAINERQRLYVCDEYLFTHQRAAEESLLRARSALKENALTIISNHYWMFYHPWRDSPDAGRLSAWNDLLDDVLDKDEFEITGFADEARGK